MPPNERPGPWSPAGGTRDSAWRSRLVPLAADITRRIEAFVADSAFASTGGVVTDLDGTAVLQDGDRVYMPDSVTRGLGALHRAGRPIVINTLRFPRSIIATFAAAWFRQSDVPLSVVTLNGSLMGSITTDGRDRLAFEEREAHPLTSAEIGEVLEGVAGMLAAGDDDLVLFIYERDWRRGERAWTPRAERVAGLCKRFVSASQVVASPLEALADDLARREVCMLTLLDDRPDDKRLAFQHGARSRFVTATGVDKRSGAERMAASLGFALGASLGAGDTELDNFLDAVGLALHVGTSDLAFRGLHDTLRIAGPESLGDVLACLVEALADGGCPA